jgi:peptidoglycan hydrolase-like amidase
MALPTSGALSISMIRTELGQTAGSLGFLSSSVGKSTPHSISEVYGYSNAPANSVTFSSSFSYTGSGSGSYSGTVTIVGATATFNARSTSTGNFSTDTIININGNSRRARITTAGTLNSTTFSLGPGTYSYTFSCQVTGGGTGIGQIIFTQ